MRGVHQLQVNLAALCRLSLTFAEGYDACKQLTGPDFLSVYNLHLWASNAKMINYYMLYG
jgi:hypothetical protein